MRNTTLCHIEKDGKYLMLHRVKKDNDLNHDKWVGIGGKFEDKESPEECNAREVYEETGLTVNNCSYRGIVTFVSDKWETEYMHLFVTKDFTGEIKECDEGNLEWIDKKALYSLPIWQGDKIFLKLLEDESYPFFSLKLEYCGDKLINAVLNGKQSRQTHRRNFMNICIYGASSNLIDASFIKSGEELGEALAKSGHGIIFGGGANGMMGAVARGTHKGNGKIIGIAPSFFNVDGVLYEHCTEFIYTETMRERKKKMEELSDAFIVTPGGIGTLDEFFEILTLRQLSRHSKPIAVFNINGYFDPMKKMLENAVNQKFMKESNLKLCFLSDNISDIIEYFEEYNPDVYSSVEYK